MFPNISAHLVNFAHAGRVLPFPVGLPVLFNPSILLDHVVHGLDHPAVLITCRRESTLRLQKSHGYAFFHIFPCSKENIKSRNSRVAICSKPMQEYIFKSTSDFHVPFFLVTLSIVCETSRNKPV